MDTSEDLDALVQGSKKLAAAIHGIVSESTVPRSLGQVEQDSRNLSSAKERPTPDAATYRFLATEGIDARGLDPVAMDLGSSEGAPQPRPAHPDGEGIWPLEWDGDIDGLLKRDQHKQEMEATEWPKRQVHSLYERTMREHAHKTWQAQKVGIMQMLRNIDLPQTPQAAPAAAPAVAAAPPAAVLSAAPSRTRGPRHMAYGGVISELLSQRSGGGAANTGFKLYERLAAAAEAGGALGDGSSAKLVSCWKLLASMAQSGASLLRPAFRPGALAAAEGPYQSHSIELQGAMLEGALQHLGQQHVDEMQRRIKTALDGARRGGGVGVEHDGAAMARIQRQGTLHAERTGPLLRLGANNEEPLWQVAYYCVRSHDLSAAIRVLTSTSTSEAFTAPPRLLALLQLLAGSPHASYELVQAVRAAADEYWVARPQDKYEQAIYSVLAAPEPNTPLKDLLPDEANLFENWLWHKLSVTRVLLLCEDPNLSGPSSSLSELQTLLYDRHGEAHFATQRQSPLLFFSVLLYSQQFERAVSFLYAAPALADEAMHFALALQHEGMLSCCASSGASDCPLIVDDAKAAPKLLLASMMFRQLSHWVGEDPKGALGYVSLLICEQEARESLAAELLLRSGQTGAVLEELPFLDQPTKTSLMRRLATRLQREQGLEMQAARLLYEAKDYIALATLLAEQISKRLVSSVPSPQAVSGFESMSQLRADADTFLLQWRRTEPEQAQQHSAPLQYLLQISLFLESVTQWRDDRHQMHGSEAILSKLFDDLNEITVLPADLSTLELVQAEFRLLPTWLQCTFPTLIEAAMEVAHAKFELLRAGGAPARAETELQQLRARGEALVSFAGMSLWRASEALGQLHVPAITNQRISSWLADMA